MTVQHRKFQLVSDLFVSGAPPVHSTTWGSLLDDSAENIVIHTEYRLKVSMIHIVSDQ